MEVKEMNEEQWKAASKEMVRTIIAHETAVKNEIHPILPDLEFPSASVTINTKLDELHEAFSHDGTPLHHHLIVPIESNYLIGVYTKYVKDLDAFFFGLINAAHEQNDEAIHDLIEGAPKRQQTWADLDQYILNFDFKEDLDRVFESNPLLPNGMDPAKAKAICKAELERITYTPKKYPNINEEPPAGIQMS